MPKLLLLLCSMLLWPVHALHAQIIDIAGSTTVKAFIEPAADAYRLLHPEVIMIIRGGGSGAGASAILDDRATLGMMSRELDADEQQAMLTAGVERTRVGYDAVAVVVSNELYHKAGVHALRKSDIAAIYRGELRNWRDVGGPDRRILLVDKEKHRGTRHVFAGYILGNSHADWADQAVIVGPNRDMSMLLEASDQAIGFLPFAHVNEQIHGLEIIDGNQHILPDETTIRDGSYPLARSLYVLHKKQTPPYVRDFVRFLLSDAGQTILRKSGYIPLQHTGKVSR